MIAVVVMLLANLALAMVHTLLLHGTALQSRSPTLPLTIAAIRGLRLILVLDILLSFSLRILLRIGSRRGCGSISLVGRTRKLPCQVDI